jgi:hypothetical protein
LSNAKCGLVIGPWRATLAEWLGKCGRAGTKEAYPLEGTARTVSPWGPGLEDATRTMARTIPFLAQRRPRDLRWDT